MPLPRYERDVTSHHPECQECKALAAELYISPLSGEAQELIGEDNKATMVAVPKVVCATCYRADYAIAYPGLACPAPEELNG